MGGKKKKKRKEGGGGGLGGGGGTTVIVQFDTHDMKASREGASTTSMGNVFQSLMVLGLRQCFCIKPSLIICHT